MTAEAGSNSKKGVFRQTRTTNRDIRAALDGSAVLDAKTVERERSADVGRCNALLEQWLPQATDVDSKRAKLASEIVHRAMTRRARLLGLDFAAAGSGTSVAIQVNNAAPVAALPDIDFSTWSDAEIRAWRFLADKARGISPAGSLDGILAASERAPMIVIEGEAA